MRLALAAAAGALWAAAPAAAAPCDALKTLSLPADVRVLRANPVASADRFVPPNVPGAKPIAVPFCRVEGVIEAEIGSELWLPEAWSGRFLAGGVGGQAGQFNYRDMARGLARGYAAASTDTGRGRQALTEAQRYPEDYDGILAGAPGVNTPEMSARRMWEMVQHSAAGELMPVAAWSRIAAAGVAACDGKDGVRDGVVEDAGACRFDIASLSCAKSAGDGCLTDAQVRFARRLYAPLHDETGRRIDEGLLPGVRIQPQAAPEPFTPGPPTCRRSTG